MSRGWRFDLPPSLGRESVRALAREFAALLYEYGFTTVAPAESYAVLEERLLSGEADAAWGPPLVCARLEAAGAPVALRAIRHGATGYRSVLVCRIDDKLDLTPPVRTRRRPRAVWVDQHSMAGHILPRAHIRALGMDPKQFFLAESFGGSYERCLEDVLEGNADVTATFASAAGAKVAVDGFEDMAGFRAVELRPLAYTAECPNDGVVLSPRLVPATAHALKTALRRLLADDASRALFTRTFDVDGFDEPPPGLYKPLLELISEKAPGAIDPRSAP